MLKLHSPPVIIILPVNRENVRFSKHWHKQRTETVKGKAAKVGHRHFQFIAERNIVTNAHRV